MHVIPIIITCMLQGTLCDIGIPHTFYGGNICSVAELQWLISIGINRLLYLHRGPRSSQELLTCFYNAFQKESS